MTLTYTPAYTITIPDTYTDDDTNITYTVSQDTDAIAPRLYWDSNVALYVYQPWQYSDPEPQLTTRSTPVDKLVRAFTYYVRHYPIDQALALTRRFARFVYPESRYSIDTRHLTGNSPSDWRDCLIVVNTTDPTSLTDDQIIDSYAQEYEMWANGSVYVVSSDGPNDEPLGDIYAESPEEAVHYYIDYYR